MAKQKLSELPVVTTINQTDLMYVVQSSTSKATNVGTVFASVTTANIRESSSNLYFTNARARNALTVTGGATYDKNTGLLIVTGLGVEYVANINGANGQVILTTANIAEEGNLYFTNTRVVSALIAGDYITIEANGRISSLSPGTITANDLTTANVVELNNLYYSNSRVHSNIYPLLTTANIVEVGNLYYSDERVYANIHPLLTTANIAEIDNLYYTNARVYSNIFPLLNQKANVSDLANLNITNLGVANSISANSFISTGTGVPTLSSSTNINLDANAAVVVTRSVFRLANFTDGQVANLIGVAGDIVFNSTNNKFQGYTTSGWVDLH